MAIFNLLLQIFTIKFYAILSDFWISFWSNFLSTLVATVVLFYFLEKRIILLQTRKEAINFLANLNLELTTNYIIAERIVANSTNSLEEDQFPISQFKLLYIRSFLSARPIENENKLYIKLNSLIANMEAINSLLDLVFSSQNQNTIKSNKHRVNVATPKLLDDISKMLTDLEEISKRHNIKG